MLTKKNNDRVERERGNNEREKGKSRQKVVAGDGTERCGLMHDS